jgi:hypothetical protein
MQTFMVDYNRTGAAKVVRVKLWPQHRGRIRVGSTVLVTGDDVNDRRASVQSLSSDGRYAVLVFIDALFPAADRQSA